MKKINKIILYIFYTSLFITPWMHGLELLYEIMFFGMTITLLTVIQIALNPRKTKKAIIRYRYIIIAIAMLVAYQWTKLTPGLDGFSTINMSASYLSNLKLTIFFVYFFLNTLLISNKKIANEVVLIIIVSATLNSTYSLLNHYWNGAFEIISAIEPYGVIWENEVRGTFSYKNHYASYLSIIILLSFWKIEQETNKFTGRYITLVIFLALLFFTLIKTGSRGATIALIITISIIIFINFKHNLRYNLYNNRIKYISVMTFAIMLFSFSSVTINRFQELGFSSGGRNLMINTVLEISKNENLLFGNGPSTYPYIQHKYKQPELGATSMSKHAHNDYLEQLTNIGIVGYFIVIAGFFLTIWQFKSLQKEKKYREKNIWLKSTFLYLSIHSMIDFNLSLPTIITLLTTTLCIILVSERWIKPF